MNERTEVNLMPHPSRVHSLILLTSLKLHSSFSDILRISGLAAFSKRAETSEVAIPSLLIEPGPESHSQKHDTVLEINQLVTRIGRTKTCEKQRIENTIKHLFILLKSRIQIIFLKSETCTHNDKIRSNQVPCARIKKEYLRFVELLLYCSVFVKSPV